MYKLLTNNNEFLSIFISDHCIMYAGQMLLLWVPEIVKSILTDLFWWSTIYFDSVQPTKSK